jgi:hypothetical protein
MHYKLQRSFPLVTMGATHITNNETIPTTTLQSTPTPV